MEAHRINLRLNARMFEAIERLRQEGNGSVSYNAWVTEAIQEKIARDCIREVRTPTYAETQRTFYEFFAGGGMARLGLGSGWTCLLANDCDPQKARTYRANWNEGAELLVEDINRVQAAQLPGRADLAWASFPCQDLSRAGKAGGLGRRQDKTQTRSGTFWPFWQLISALVSEGRAPQVIALENVVGVLTSNRGSDFAAIGSALVEAGYKFGALVIDARMFLPQSRPRVFIIGLRSDMAVEPRLISEQATTPWHTEAVTKAYSGLTAEARDSWIWWKIPRPPKPQHRFVDLIEDHPEGVNWHTATETARLTAMMSPLNAKKLEQATCAGKRTVGGVYKRTRLDTAGNKVQRAEVRFDDVAGCLRTPSGGSSRQLVLVVEGNRVRSRLLSPREAARLMGLPDAYKLPANYNEAYHLAGDGVVVPVVRFLAEHLLEPLVDNNRTQALLPFRAA